MSNIEKIRQEIERQIEALEYVKMLKSKYKHKDSLPEDASCVYDTNKLTPTPSVNIEDVARVQFASHAKVFDKKRKAVFDWEQFKEVAGIFYGFGKRDSLPDEKPSEDLEEEAARYERENRQSVLSSVDIVNAFISGGEWQARQLLKSSPLPENTVLFQKGVEEGKRLMMEEAVEAKIYGYGDGSFELIASWLDMPNNSIYKDGDKVKIVIIKGND